MKKFRFRLETPLKLRRRKVDQCSQALAKARTVWISALRELERLNSERTTWGKSYVTTPTGEIDVPRDYRRREYLDQLDADILSQKTWVDQCAGKAAEAETALRLAVRDREILERLKEVRKRSHDDEVRALDTKRSDFAAAAFFRRNVP